jgi:hypothetical protein
MPTLLTRLALLGCLLCSLCSCASQLKYEDVQQGRIVGKPGIVWESPDRFMLRPDKARPFRFVRHNGDVIVPQDMRTDCGSIPRVLWSYHGFSPWEYAPAYLIHDWLYESKRRGLRPGSRSSGIYRANGSVQPYTREEADEIMAEVIKTQMCDPSFTTKESAWHLEKIHWAVHRYGKAAWDGRPDPVHPETESGPSVTAGDLLPLAWLKPIRTEISSQMLRSPMSGSQKPRTRSPTQPGSGVRPDSPLP